MTRLLLCTDLDRTLIPNGKAPESPGARDRFRALVERPEVLLAYVTGRDHTLVDQAMASWNLPVPDLLLGDVGTTIAEPRQGQWKRWDNWDRFLASDWPESAVEVVSALLGDVPGLALQDATRQGRFKVSFTAGDMGKGPELTDSVRGHLQAGGLHARVVWSLDEEAGVGLLDILPQASSKLGAIEFVMDALGYGKDEVVFAGDSGNDFDVLASRIPSVLVANAREDLRNEARRAAAAAGNAEALYCAHGDGPDGPDGNGNYAAGILEGVRRYHPGLFATGRKAP